MRSDRVKTWFRNRQMVSRGFRDFSMRATAVWKAAYMWLHARTRLDLGCMMGKMYYLERRKTLGVESRFGAGRRRLGIIFSTRQAEKTGCAHGAYWESDMID